MDGSNFILLCISQWSNHIWSSVSVHIIIVVSESLKKFLKNSYQMGDKLFNKWSKLFKIRPHHHRWRTVQSYSPGCANVPSHVHWHLVNMIELVLPWVLQSAQPKQHLDRFSRFCGAHYCDRPTDGQTNAQRDYTCHLYLAGHPAKYRWRPLFNAATFGWRPLLDYHAVTLPI